MRFVTHQVQYYCKRRVINIMIKIYGICWTVKVRHESEAHNGLVAQWLELLVQFRVVRGSIPCEVILLFGTSAMCHGIRTYQLVCLARP